MFRCIFFFNDTAPTEIYTLSLHDALPICAEGGGSAGVGMDVGPLGVNVLRADRKSTRLNSSHANISYAVFCLKKKNRETIRKKSEAEGKYIRQTIGSGP